MSQRAAERRRSLNAICMLLQRRYLADLIKQFFARTIVQILHWKTHLKSFAVGFYLHIYLLLFNFILFGRQQSFLLFYSLYAY